MNWLMVTAVAVGVVAPTGVTLEPSGFATILAAPPAPLPARPPRAPPRPVTETGWYAAENHISNSEAARRMAEQQAVFPAFKKLQALLGVKERGNFTDVRMVHRPGWAYVFYFKRAPAATLARYTRNPHFKAAEGRYTRAELDALVNPWAERFTKAGILGGYGTDATFGVADLTLSVTEQDYRALAAKEKWGPVPGVFKMEFALPLIVPAVDPRAAPLLNAFVSERAATTIQLAALGTGRIIIKNGCLRLGSAAGPLAIFHRETGIGFDTAGYLVLIDRLTGKPSGRIGETFAWGGPNGDGDGIAGVAELRQRCGVGPVINLGNPESKAWFDTRYSRR